MGLIRLGLIIASATIIAVAFLPKLPSFGLLLFFSFSAIAGYLFKFLRRFSLLLLWLVFGLWWASGYGYLGLKQQLPHTLEGEDVWVEGEVTGLPVVTERSQRFEFKVLNIENQPSAQWLKKVRINWYQTEQQLEPGQRWKLLLRLKRPHGFANPGGFDYQGWLFQQGIGATGYVRTDPGNHLLAENGYRQLIDQWRYGLYKRLSKRLDTDPNKGLMLALLMGERGDVSREQWRLLSRTGTNHLFVISGLHVGFVALCAYLLFYNISRLLLIGPPRFAAQQVGVIAALFAGFIYASIAGFSLPTQRALIMLVVMLAGRLFRRRVDVWHSYCLALLLVLLWDPLASQSVGFWLSFGAVGSLLYAFGLRTSNRGIWWRWFRPQVVVFVAFVPVLLFFFQQISLISPLANVVAIPVIGFLMVPLCVLVVLLELVMPLIDVGPVNGLLDLMTTVCRCCLMMLVSLLEWLAAAPFAQWSKPLCFWSLLCVLGGALLLLAPRGLPARWLGLVCFLPLFASFENRLGLGQFEVTVLDVGQGLSVHIRTQRHDLIYDVGARFNDKFDMASSVILPYLRQQNTQSLDRAVVSHGDNDHAGSLPVLLSEIAVGQVISGASDNLASSRDCEDGAQWLWDEVRFQLMQADSRLWSNENNRSCILKVDGRDWSVLIPGDIEVRAEHDLVMRYGDRLRSDLLLAAHHGSLTSSSPIFLDKVQPELVIFSSGYRNRFGHPHPKVAARFQRRDVRQLNTADQGAINVLATEEGEGLYSEPYRQAYRRYWF